MGDVTEHAELRRDLFAQVYRRGRSTLMPPHFSAPASVLSAQPTPKTAAGQQQERRGERPHCLCSSDLGVVGPWWARLSPCLLPMAFGIL